MSVIQALTGIDAATGQKLTFLERVLGLLPGEIPGKIFKGKEIVGDSPRSAAVDFGTVAANDAIRAGGGVGPPSFSAGPNKSYFWSGLGPGGARTATTIAHGGGGMTLEMFIETRGIQMPVWDSTNSASIKAWEDVSRIYASSASGEVRVVLGNNLRPGNIWQSVELPALSANPSVTRIIEVNPITKTETVLWNR
jgi:hypothetical protein